MSATKEAKQVRRIRGKYAYLKDDLNERLRRRWAAMAPQRATCEALEFGHGGIKIVAKATGLHRNTITHAIHELEEPDPDEDKARVRREGGGRQSLTEHDTGLLEALERLIDPDTRGDGPAPRTGRAASEGHFPESPLRWTCKSTYLLASALSDRIAISPRSVARLLHEEGYSLQGNQKTLEGADHGPSKPRGPFEGLGHLPDRNAQFENINTSVKRFQHAGQPVISVDTKKKELIGPYFKGGREWQAKGKPEQVKTHDFIDTKLGKVIPYGVYDVTQDTGWVSVGIDHDTAEFAARAIERWWKKLGSETYPSAKKLMLTADGGGSNGSRNRLWKVSLQGVSNKIGIPITVCHFPPGTSKWNKIEHRMFSFITQNWRGRPLISHEVVIKLIARTATKSGLKIRAEMDKQPYETGITVTDKELEQIKIKREEFHGNWNYTIMPK